MALKSGALDHQGEVTLAIDGLALMPVILEAVDRMFDQPGCVAIPAVAAPHDAVDADGFRNSQTGRHFNC